MENQTPFRFFFFLSFSYLSSSMVRLFCCISFPEERVKLDVFSSQIFSTLRRNFLYTSCAMWNSKNASIQVEDKRRDMVYS